MFRWSVRIIIYWERSISTESDFGGMDSISSAIDDSFEYILCGNCQIGNELVMDGPAADERYPLHTLTMKASA